MRSRTDQSVRQVTPPDRTSRHVTLFSQGGLVTVLERVGAGSGERYILRHQYASQAADAELLFDLGTAPDQMFWTGFRYQKAEWSFVKRKTSTQLVD